MQLGCTGATGAQPRALQAGALCTGQGSCLCSHSCVSELTIMGPSPWALRSSSQSLHLKVKTSKKLDSLCQLPPVSFPLVPSNEQHLFFLMWQWTALWCFLVFIINLWPSFLITRYQLLLPTTPSARPWELMVQATFSIFPFRLHTTDSPKERSCMTSHKVCIWLIFFF